MALTGISRGKVFVFLNERWLSTMLGLRKQSMSGFQNGKTATPQNEEALALFYLLTGIGNSKFIEKTLESTPFIHRSLDPGYRAVCRANRMNQISYQDKVL
jgi:hypothetical protein